MSDIEASGIREMFHMARDMESPTDLSIGQPHYDVPRRIKNEKIDAIQEGKNKYTQTRGLKKLRREIRRTLQIRDDAEPDDLMVTSGVSGALFLIFHVLLDPGDEVLIPDPYFVMYKHLTNAVHGTPRFLDTYPDFKIDPDHLEEAIGPETKLLIFNNPVNPTGIAYREEEVKAVAEVCRNRDVMIVADEIYADFTYDFPHTSMYPHAPDHTILTGGFSKTYGMPGWRVGYAAGDENVLDHMSTLQQFSFVCANTPAQHACIEALDMDMSMYIERYRDRRDYVEEHLSSSYDVVHPAGAFYVFPTLPGDVPPEPFLNRAIEKELMVVPGKACSERNTHFRISYAVDMDILKRGVDLLNEIAEELA